MLFFCPSPFLSFTDTEGNCVSVKDSASLQLSCPVRFSSRAWTLHFMSQLYTLQLLVANYCEYCQSEESYDRLSTC